MRYKKAIHFILISLICLLGTSSNAAPCKGHFVNPLTDICWSCLFPLSIGGTSVVHSSLPDTPNASSPIGLCHGRIGLNIGFWEPFAIADVTDTPYCMVNLGGMKLNLGIKQAQGGRKDLGTGQLRGFYQVHWYKYPLLSWLNLITSLGCREGGDFDIAYLTELDPTWNDSEMSFVLSPESVLFGNPLAGAACAADSIKSTFNQGSIDSLFWCAGSQGSHYPLSGHVNAPISPVQTALLLTERLNYKLHRERFIADSSPQTGAICEAHHFPVTPKSRYRYEMVNQIADGKHCYPSGASTLSWEAGKIKAHTPSQYGFLVWRKRNCTYM